MAKNEIVSFGKIADINLSDVPSLTDCSPGMEPVEYNLLIIPANPPKKVGAIFIPDESRDRMGMAAQVGRIVAASPLAFSYDAWPEGSRKPQVGDVVWFARYAGGLFEGADGKEYRIIKDKDIGAVISRKVSHASRITKNPARGH